MMYVDKNKNIVFLQRFGENHALIKVFAVEANNKEVRISKLFQSNILPLPLAERELKRMEAKEVKL